MASTAARQGSGSNNNVETGVGAPDDTPTVLPITYRWEYHCVDEDKTFLVCTRGEIPPTKCVNDARHTVTPESVRRVCTTMADSSLPNENQDHGNEKFVSGLYRAANITIRLTEKSPNSVETFYTTPWPINRCFMSVQFSSRPEQFNDRIKMFTEMHPMPELKLAAPVGPGAMSLQTTKSVLAMLQPGYELLLREGDTIENLGMVIRLDWNHNRIHFQTATSGAFTVAARLEFRVVFAELTFPPRGRDFLLASTKHGGARVNKDNYRIGIEYHNTRGGGKDADLFIEFTT